LTRRYYQFFALAILIGAPLLVSLLNHLIFGLAPLASQLTQAPATPDYMTPAAEAAPPAATTSMPPSQMQAGAQANVGPIDPSGTEISGMEISGADPVPADAEMGGAAPSMDPSPALSLPEG